MPASAVRWFHSGMSGAPVLSGTAGALIGILDACLINGFDTRTINTLVVSGGVATATISAGHVYDVHAVIRIAGVTGALSVLNDDWRITSATGSTLTFACPGVADGSATGTITCKRSPAGWGKAFSATNKAVYRSANLLSTRLFLRVDDTIARNARVRGYEQMTDVDTGTNLFPTLASRAETAYAWLKSSVADSSARPWTIICDDAFIYLLTKYDTGGATTNTLYWFGDVVSYIPGDAFHCAIAATGTENPSSAGGLIGTMTFNSTSVQEVMARRADQTTLTPQFARLIPTTSTSVPFSSSGSFPAYPAPDGALHLYHPVLLPDTGVAYGTTVPVRGHMPGFAAPWHSAPLSHLAMVEGAGAFTGRRVMMVAADMNNTVGRIALDITGPWR